MNGTPAQTEVRRVMIVDDDPDALALMENILTDDGFELVKVSNASDWQSPTYSAQAGRQVLHQMVAHGAPARSCSMSSRWPAASMSSGSAISWRYLPQLANLRRSQVSRHTR